MEEGNSACVVLTKHTHNNQIPRTFASSAFGDSENRFFEINAADKLQTYSDTSPSDSTSAA